MQTHPNVLLICVDHWFSGLLETAGRTDIETPTLNRLCEVGTRYSRTYSETPICIPARRTLMTGTSPRIHGDRTFQPDLPMPDFPTLPSTFSRAGYQTYAVGKLHVYPPRDRIGFDDVILAEEGRSGLGWDDYDAYLGEQGHAGQQFMHGMSNNEYSWRPWHLAEEHHVTNWITREACKTFKRRDPTRPAFWYVSYTHPHPPLAPLEHYLARYANRNVQPAVQSDWSQNPKDLPAALQTIHHYFDKLSPQRLAEVRRAFYALCTHIDHQIRLLIGTLREEQVLDDTVLAFVSDHGDMLGDHGLFAKRTMLEGSCNVPFILADTPAAKRVAKGAVDTRLVGLQDIMPTLLDLANIPIPETCTGRSVLGEKREYLYCEVLEDHNAQRMVTDDKFKLIWYPAGNHFQLFDIVEDPEERFNLVGQQKYQQQLEQLKNSLKEELYGSDLAFVKEGDLVGCPAPPHSVSDNRGLTGQRGLQFPPIKPADPGGVIEPKG